MDTRAYKDGYEKGTHAPKEVSRRLLRKAIRDCKEMGWSHLGEYFKGKLAGCEAAGRGKA